MFTTDAGDGFLPARRTLPRSSCDGALTDLLHTPDVLGFQLVQGRLANTRHPRGLHAALSDSPGQYEPVHHTAAGRLTVRAINV
jgi:hypothetical protein